MPPPVLSIVADSRQISTPARFAALPELHAWLVRLGEQEKLDEELLERLQLTVEELFANSIHHGYCGECDALVSMELRIEADTVRLTYCDRGAPFNLQQAAPTAASPERLGGFGLNLVRALSNAIEYRHEHDTNITELVFSRRNRV